MKKLPTIYEDVLVLTPDQPDTRGRVTGYGVDQDSGSAVVLVTLRDARWVPAEKPGDARFAVSTIVVHPDNLVSVKDRVTA